MRIESRSSAVARDESAPPGSRGDIILCGCPHWGRRSDPKATEQRAGKCADRSDAGNYAGNLGIKTKKAPINQALILNAWYR